MKKYRLLTRQACRDCTANRKLIDAAGKASVSLSVVIENTAETEKAYKLGLKLPVLVRDDGAMSENGRKWHGGLKKKPQEPQEPQGIEITE